MSVLPYFRAYVFPPKGFCFRCLGSRNPLRESIASPLITLTHP